jgi:hypothetical protein
MALGNHGNEQERRNRGIKRAGDDGSMSRCHRRETRTASHANEHHAGCQQRQPSAARDNQGLEGGGTCLSPLVVEANEQERCEACQLPEDEERQNVVAQCNPEHGAHEGKERCVESPGLWMSFEIAARVEHDERADRRNQQREQQAKRIEAE